MKVKSIMTCFQETYATYLGCAVLHNIAINQNLSEINDNLDQLPVHDEIEHNFIVNDNFNNGFLTRENIVDRYFYRIKHCFNA